MPSDQMSAGYDSVGPSGAASLMHNSGAVNAGVPHAVLWLRSMLAASSSESSKSYNLAVPKSEIFTLPSALASRLSGLMSRCTMRLLCRYSSALIASRNTLRARSSPSGVSPSSRFEFITTPFAMYSTTMYSLSFSSSSNTPSMRSTLGWFSFFMIAISRRSPSELISPPAALNPAPPAPPWPALRICFLRITFGITFTAKNSFVRHEIASFTFPNDPRPIVVNIMYDAMRFRSHTRFALK
mmetsp:Transcript_14643/g.31392  ORF Transcript_14643/g.31392 Transcript_14643/m.31392 type:complete len:241 (-) Transcript_14643:440-1162(-)